MKMFGRITAVGLVVIVSVYLAVFAVFCLSAMLGLLLEALQIARFLVGR